MIPHVKRHRPVYGLLAIAIFSILPLQTGCGGQSTPRVPPGEPNYRIISHVQETPRTLSGVRELGGRYVIAYPKRNAHDVAYIVRQSIARSTGGLAVEMDLAVEMIDETSNSSTLLTVNDESSTVNIQSEGGVEQFVVNADGSVAVGDVTFSTTPDAVVYLASTQTMNAISDESLAAAQELLNSEIATLEGTSRGSTGRWIRATLIVAVTWGVVSYMQCLRTLAMTGQSSSYCRWILTRLTL